MRRTSLVSRIWDGSCIFGRPKPGYDVRDGIYLSLRLGILTTLVEHLPETAIFLLYFSPVISSAWAVTFTRSYRLKFFQTNPPAHSVLSFGPLIQSSHSVLPSSPPIQSYGVSPILPPLHNLTWIRLMRLKRPTTPDQTTDQRRQDGLMAASLCIVVSHKPRLYRSSHVRYI